ncbi:MAG: AraC family transcriptional regulator [Gammaproteobacteria bacterium]|jgi:AraC-like DNA-binding protein|nr:AraC family transcriptional regulator [Gammaproteobacteria bacterium]MBQ0773667.1 AraC family transcriptional regulator [Gammaproteobacteria bacterium]
MSNVPSSDNGIFLWMTYQAMTKAGLDCAAIFSSVGMPDAPPDQRERRINSPQKRFWDAAQKVSQNADIGLHIGSLMPPFRGQVLEYLFLSSPTFGEGLERTLRYNRLATDAMQFRLRVEDDVAILSGLEHPVRHYLEHATCIVLRFLQQVSDGEFQPCHIAFCHTQGASQQDYQRIYGCPVTLGAGEGAIHFDASLLTRSSLAAEPELLAMHEQLAAEKLADLRRRDFVLKLERELGGLLEQGEASLDTLAAKLGISTRNLRTELEGAGTSFKVVLNQYRERLARRLLARTSEPLDQIIYLTGFSEPAAFTRAFKRWTGETPSAYRKRLHELN